MDVKPSDQEVAKAKSRRQRIEHKIRPVIAVLGKVLSYLKTKFKIPPDDDYESTDEYKDAMKFFKEFEAKEKIKYEWVLKYAKDLHEKYEKTDALLDEKADSIIKYLGGGSAVVTFGALMSIKPERPETSLLGLAALLSLTPSLIYAILAVRAALRVRKPRSSASPPSITKAIALSENYETAEEAELNLLLIYHPICVAYIHRNAQKAKHLHYAHKFYSLSLTFLILPVIVICIVLAIQATKTPSLPPPIPPATQRTTSSISSASRECCRDVLRAEA